ncbi:MAG: DNA polymerase III subunit delta [Patescibacteria group bacterium]|jgi:DNA polymerase-3 subunit delta
MIFFLYGPDTYRSRQKLTEIKQKFLVEVDKSALNLAILDGAKLRPADLNSALATPPFLARKRLVVVTGLLSRKKNKEESEGEKEDREAIIEILKRDNLLKDVILIFWEGDKVDERTALFKRLNKEQYAQKFDLLRDAELLTWLKVETKKRGGVFAPGAGEKLVESVGSDLWQISSELDKLIAFAAGEAITLAQVTSQVKGKLDDNIFNFVDAIAQKNQKLAQKLLSDQLDSGANELYLLSMLIRQFRILLQLQDLGNVNKQQAAVALKLHPFVIQKALPQVRNFSPQKLRQIYRQLLETDIKIKLTVAEPRVLFSLLLVKIME